MRGAAPVGNGTTGDGVGWEGCLGMLRILQEVLYMLRDSIWGSESAEGAAWVRKSAWSAQGVMQAREESWGRKGCMGVPKRCHTSQGNHMGAQHGSGCTDKRKTCCMNQRGCGGGSAGQGKRARDSTCWGFLLLHLALLSLSQQASWVGLQKWFGNCHGKLKMKIM